MAEGSNVIESLDEVSEGWLTAVLTARGALTRGQVVGYEVDGGRGNWSQNGRLRLRYSDDARGERPASLFLKLVDMDTGDGEYFQPAEVTTYTRDYVDVPDAPLLRFYDGAYDLEQWRYHLLLEDVSDSHEDCYYRKPTLEFGLALAEALAILHARWWGVDWQAERGEAPHDAAFIRRFVDIGAPGVPHVKRLFGARLLSHWPALLDTVVKQLPERLIARAASGENLTLIHCDPSPGNILVPREGVRPLYLIDCQPFDWSLTRWLGPYDLAYALGLYWEPEQRAAWEIEVLRHYHGMLQARGVGTYSWDQLWTDYRLCVALVVTVAVEWVRGGGDAGFDSHIWDKVRRTLTACDELDVAGLLKE